MDEIGICHEPGRQTAQFSIADADERRQNPKQLVLLRRLLPADARLMSKSEKEPSETPEGLCGKYLAFHSVIPTIDSFASE